MAKKKVKIRRIRFNSRLTLEEVVRSLIIVLVISVIVSFSSTFIYNHFAVDKDSINDEEEKLEFAIASNGLKESPYTLDEIYDFISSGDIWKVHLWESSDKISINFVITHFYEYFSEDTPFMIYERPLYPYFDFEDAVDGIGVTYISYNEYMNEFYNTDDEYFIEQGVYDAFENEVSKNRDSRGRNLLLAAQLMVGSCDKFDKCNYRR